jgi:hypothetical protein
MGFSSVADPESLSQIPDPKTATKKEGEKMYCPTFFIVSNNTKLKII